MMSETPGTDEEPDSVLASREWDAIVVGGGMGGAASAWALSAAGFRVLLIEKGYGNFQPLKEVASIENADERLDAGHWPHKIRISVDGRESEIWPAMGSGIGGSTLLYAATVGRLEKPDFELRPMPDGREVAWPISYPDLEPYYLAAERQLEVCGTADPRVPEARYELGPPPAMGAPDRAIFDRLRASGLHPFRLHNAIRYDEGCTECGGVVCPRACKGDARSRFAEPAMRTGNLSVLTGAEVTAFTADRTSIHNVLARTCSGDHAFRARVVVLAAGALVTPALLQKATSKSWPKGIGNDRDLVGRNLMFHASDFVAIWAGQRAESGTAQRTIAFRDFYRWEGESLGEVQSMGLRAGYGEILTYLHQSFDESLFRRMRALRPLLRLPARIAAAVLKEATVFTTIVEDHPYLRNRVVPSDHPSGFEVDYEIPGELRARVTRIRKLLRSRLDGLRVLVMNTDVSLNYGHACGTCRMGEDPSESVVDAQCRIHGMSNLYVLDGSVMPTSGGTNPSLTIAANALRVSDGIVERLKNGEL